MGLVKREISVVKEERGREGEEVMTTVKAAVIEIKTVLDEDVVDIGVKMIRRKSPKRKTKPMLNLVVVKKKIMLLVFWKPRLTESESARSVRKMKLSKWKKSAKSKCYKI